MKTIFRVIKAAGTWKWSIIVATFTLLIVVAINLVTPMVARELLELIEPGDIAVTSTIWIMAGVLLGLYLFRVVAQYLSFYRSHVAAWGVVAKMRGELYSHMQTLSMNFFANRQTGQLMSRVSEDTLNLENLVAHALPDLIVNILIAVGVLVMLFVMNPMLAALVSIPLPLVLSVSIIMRKTRKTFVERKVIRAEFMGMLSDNFQGIKEIQVFNKQKAEAERIRQKANRFSEISTRSVFWFSVMNPILGFLQGIGTIAIILFGGLMALNGNMAAGEITAFLLYIGLLYTPVAGMARMIEDIQDAVTSANRIFEILDTKADIVDLPDACAVGELKGNIEFRNVSFSYNNDVQVLKNVSFAAPAGQMVALVGSTGAGKTTIASLLARFYDVTDGSITIDGIDIRNMTLESLRNQISIVLQDVFLFNGTIASNIAYGRSDEVSPEEIIEAARVAAVHDFIDGLPDKYNTVVGERGTRLSGGQKQRIAIARAILRKSPILILDEATSSVDNETEREIQKAIDRIAGSRTLIVIAHRLTTIEKADKVLKLENGCLTAQNVI